MEKRYFDEIFINKNSIYFRLKGHNRPFLALSNKEMRQTFPFLFFAFGDRKVPVFNLVGRLSSTKGGSGEDSRIKGHGGPSSSSSISPPFLGSLGLVRLSSVDLVAGQLEMSLGRFGRESERLSLGARFSGLLSVGSPMSWDRLFGSRLVRLCPSRTDRVEDGSSRTDRSVEQRHRR